MLRLISMILLLLFHYTVAGWLAGWLVGWRSMAWRGVWVHGFGYWLMCDYRFFAALIVRHLRCMFAERENWRQSARATSRALHLISQTLVRENICAIFTMNTQIRNETATHYRIRASCPCYAIDYLAMDGGRWAKNVWMCDRQCCWLHTNFNFAQNYWARDCVELIR